MNRISKLLFTVLISTSLNAQVPTLVEDETAFGLSLYEQLNQKKENLIYSPYSIFTCLSMAYMGAEDVSAAEMKEALHISLNPEDLAKESGILTEKIISNPESKYTLNIANALWFAKDSDILFSYRNTIEDDFKAKIDTLDFTETAEAIKTINAWIADATSDKITDLLHPGDLTRYTRIVLTNAVYYQSPWKRRFDPKLTQERPFYPAPGEASTALIMSQKGYFPYFENDIYQAAALPLEDHFALLLVLPKEKMPTLSSGELSSLLGSLNRTYLDLHLPKFNIRKRLDLSKPLINMGMEEPFSTDANFAGINGMRNLQISKILHEALIEVDENGLVAAAATAVAMTTTNLITDQPIDFNANHPFLFFLVDMKTKTPLFMGKLYQPL